MSHKRHVLHLIQSLDSGGCEHMLLRILPLLTEEFQHSIITLHNLGELAPQFREKGIAVTTLGQRNLLDVLSYQRLLTEVKQYSPDVIITYLFHADLVGRLFLARKVSVPIIPFLRTTYNHPKYFIARLFAKSTRSLVQRYLANSEAVKQFYTQHIGVLPERITVIPNGIDIERFRQLTPSSELRQSLGLTKNDMVIISVANLHPNKGHRFLLEALNTCRDLPIKLLVVGDGKERRALEEQVTTLNLRKQVMFLGKRHDVPDLLALSHIFVLPTLFEGQSNAILEAMAMGLPVITTDIPENRELIHDQENGWLVPPKTVSPLAEALRTLAQTEPLRTKLGTQAHLTIQNQFSLTTSANRFSNFLSSL